MITNGIAESRAGSITFVFPSNPSREGTPLRPLVDDYGNDFVSEHFRMMSIVDAGWLYYSFLNPTTGRIRAQGFVLDRDWLDGQSRGSRNRDLQVRNSTHER